MKFLLQKLAALRYSGVLVFGLAVSQLCVLPLMADDFVNISDVKGCRGINGDVERLSCYDTVIDGGVFNEQKLRQVRIEEFGSETMPKDPAPTVTKAPETKPTIASPTPQATPAPADVKEVSADKLNVTIVRTKKGAGGIYYFQTSEGQVWKQQNAVSWNLKAPFDAKIEKGAMGSFFLIHKGGKSTRVKRVK